MVLRIVEWGIGIVGLVTIVIGLLLWYVSGDE